MSLVLGCLVLDRVVEHDLLFVECIVGQGSRWLANRSARLLRLLDQMQVLQVQSIVHRDPHVLQIFRQLLLVQLLIRPSVLHELAVDVPPRGCCLLEELVTRRSELADLSVRRRAVVERCRPFPSCSETTPAVLARGRH